jgi:DNA-binding transcriptional LysR family regulator
MEHTSIMKDAHDLQRLDLNLLFVFDALLREGSVTRAGSALGLSQSAMSHSLARLRTFFDDPLFVKTHRGVAPTAKAEMLGPIVLGVMETLRDEVFSQSSFDPKRARRTFTFCMTDMGELVFLPPLLARLKVEAPHCVLRTLQVPFEQIESTLGSGEADASLGSGTHEGLFHQDLFHHGLVCIVSTKNKDVKNSITPEQFARLSHIGVALADSANQYFNSALDNARIQRTVKVWTSHHLFVPLLLDQHPEYIATVPDALGTVFARHKIVRIVPPPIALPTFALRQYWHPRFHHDRAGRWLRTLISETLSELPANMR